MLELCSAGRAPLSSLLFLAPSSGISFQGWDRPRWVGFVIPAVLIGRVAGLRGRACRRGEGRALSACSFLFPSLSTVSFPNSFLLFVGFAVRIRALQQEGGKVSLCLGYCCRGKGARAGCQHEFATSSGHVGGQTGLILICLPLALLLSWRLLPRAGSWRWLPA